MNDYFGSVDYCRYGHIRVGRCQVCQDASELRYQWRRRHGEGYVPTRRLRGLARGSGLTDADLIRLYEVRFNVGHTGGQAAMGKLRKAAITIDGADRWCVILGEHLVRVYPELYLAPLPKDMEEAA